MADRAPGWLDPVMRAGYGARGAVYVIVGGFAVAAALGSGQAMGTGEALRRLASEQWSAALLLLIGFGLALYGVWRWLDSAMDLESYGHDAKGSVARIGMIVTGAVHALLGAYCFYIVLGTSARGGGSAGGGSGGATQGATAWLLQQQWGRWAVIAIGVVVVGAGLYYINKGYSAKYRRRIRFSEMTRKLDPLMKFGVIAHGVVIVMIGCFIFWAGWTHDSSEAGGLGQAFTEMREQAYGRVLIGLAALGLVGFAVFCLCVAFYGIVPRVADRGTATLGGDTIAKVSRRVQRA